jgi:hypothetical protein
MQKLCSFIWEYFAVRPHNIYACMGLIQLICTNAALTIFGDFIQTQIWVDLDRACILFCASCGVGCHLYSSQKSFQWTHRTRSREIGHHMHGCCMQLLQQHTVVRRILLRSLGFKIYSAFYLCFSFSKLNLLNNLDQIYRKMYQFIQYSIRCIKLSTNIYILMAYLNIYLNLYSVPK